MNLLKRFHDFMYRTGQRRTTAQDALVDEVLSVSGTFEPDKVFARSRVKVSRATVYHMLGLLKQADVIRQVELNGRTMYVLTAD